MDKMKRRKLRRSGTLKGAEQVHYTIKRAMDRAIRLEQPLIVEVPRYLRTIPPVEFDTLFKYLNEVSMADRLREHIRNEAIRRAEEGLLG